MDKKTLLERITESLSSKEWMSKFANSQFVTMLANMGWQIIRTAKSESENAIPEVNLSTATKRSSILAGADDRGYVGRMVIPSTGLITIKNTAEYPVILQSGTTFLSNQQLAYMINETINIPAGKSFDGVRVYQQEKVILTTKVVKETEFMEIVFPKDISSEVSLIEVYVKINDVKERWRQNQSFRLARDTSKVYHLSYKATDQFSIKFGDGAIGMMPPEGAEIIIEVMVSKGVSTLVENQTLTPIESASQYAKVLSVKTKTPITGGEGREDIETTRQNALYYTTYDNQIIWGGDFAFFIKGNIPSIVWINVWGEAEQEKVTGFDVKNINKIFICAHKEGVSQKELHTEIEKVLKGSPKGLNLTPTYVDKNDLPFTITVNGKCEKYLNRDEVISDIKRALDEPFGENAINYASSIGETYYENMKLNKIWRRIEDLNLLTDFEVKVDKEVKAENLNDFIYIDIDNSTFNISIKGEGND